MVVSWFMVNIGHFIIDQQWDDMDPTNNHEAIMAQVSRLGSRVVLSLVQCSRPKQRSRLISSGMVSVFVYMAIYMELIEGFYPLKEISQSTNRPKMSKIITRENHQTHQAVNKIWAYPQWWSSPHPQMMISREASHLLQVHLRALNLLVIAGWFIGFGYRKVSRKVAYLSSLNLWWFPAIFPANHLVDWPVPSLNTPNYDPFRKPLILSVKGPHLWRDAGLHQLFANTLTKPAKECQAQLVPTGY